MRDLGDRGGEDRRDAAIDRVAARRHEASARIDRERPAGGDHAVLPVDLSSNRRRLLTPPAVTETNAKAATHAGASRRIVTGESYYGSTAHRKDAQEWAGRKKHERPSPAGRRARSAARGAC